MAIITLLGGHGVGKSTAVKRWKSKYGVDVYSLDDLRKEYYDNSAKCELVKRLQAERKVSVVETAKGYSAMLLELSETDPIIIVSPSSPEVGRKLMESRKGKPLTAWWGPDQLQYELIDKFKNFVVKNLNEAQCRFFSITTQETDWEAVDEYFGCLFRKLHNQMVRSQS